MFDISTASHPISDFPEPNSSALVPVETTIPALLEDEIRIAIARQSG